VRKLHGLAATLFAGLACAALGSCSDAKTPGWDLARSVPTGIVPEMGTYRFSEGEHFEIVDGGGLLNIRFSMDGYRWDTFYIYGGAFYNEWGGIYTRHCPTDGYAISGHFLTPTYAEGEIDYMDSFHCNVGSRHLFTATKQ
jgi:hypothetical protein